MRFSTVFSVLACGAMALAAAVAPDALVSRANNEISEVLSALDNKCDSILPLFGQSFLPLSDKVWDTQPCPEDECKDSKCTESLVAEIVTAVEVATSACVELKGVLALSIAKHIVAIVIVSLEPSSGSVI